MRQQLMKCFLSAPSDFDTQPLLSTLARRGIEVRTLDLATQSGVNVIDLVLRSMEEADFVCIVLTQGASRNLWFELGLAHGIKAPVFIIAEPDVESPLSPAIPYIQTNAINQETLDLHLDAFLLNTPKRRRKQPPPGRSKIAQKHSPLKLEQARKDLEAVRVSAGPVVEKEFGSIIARILQQAGYSVVLSPAQSIRDADMAVWIDETNTPLNPVLLDLKLGFLSDAALEQHEKALRSAIAARRGGSGLVVYLDRTKKTFRKERPSVLPVVVSISADELIEVARTRSLAELLRTVRNESVHRH